AGLAHLAGLAGLVELELAGTAVTDKGLVRLKQHPQLRVLDLAGTKVTDDGVAKLAGLKGPRLLVGAGTEGTERAAEPRRKALPKCRIEMGPEKIAPPKK